MIRHEQEHIEAAKKGREALYAIEINRKYTIPSDCGGSGSSRGACPAKHLPVLTFAYRVLAYEMPIEKAMEMMLQELKGMPAETPQA